MKTQPLVLMSCLVALGMGACTPPSPPSPAPTSSLPQGNPQEDTSTTPQDTSATALSPSPNRSEVTAAPAPPSSAADSPRVPQLEGPSSVLTSANQTTRLILPRGWTNQLEQDAPLDMQVANPSGDALITVQTTSKQDLPGLSLKQVSTLLLEGTRPAISNPDVKGPTTVTIVNGHPAMQHTIEGKISDLEMMMVHTTVETNQHYHQILAAVPRARFDANQADIQQVIQSFQVLPPTEPAS